MLKLLRLCKARCFTRGFMHEDQTLRSPASALHCDPVQLWTLTQTVRQASEQTPLCWQVIPGCIECDAQNPSYCGRCGDEWSLDRQSGTCGAHCASWASHYMPPGFYLSQHCCQ